MRRGKLGVSTINRLSLQGRMSFLWSTVAHKAGIALRAALITPPTASRARQVDAPTVATTRPRGGTQAGVRWALFALLRKSLQLPALLVRHRGPGSCRPTMSRLTRSAFSTDRRQDVDVRDNEHVSAGQMRTGSTRCNSKSLDNATANLAQSAAIEAPEDDYQRMLSDIAAQRTGRTRSGHLQPLRQPADLRHRVKGGLAKVVTLQGDRSKRGSNAKPMALKLSGNPDILYTDHPLYKQAKVTGR